MICAVILGAAGFFAVRSVLGGGFTPPAGEGGPPDLSPDPAGPPPEPSTEDSGSETLSELEDMVRRLEEESGRRESRQGGPAASGRPSAVLPPERRGILVFVIDDAGNNLKELDPFLAFPGPLTIAVLPGLPYSAEAARRIRNAEKEVFLHQPMEPLGGQNPGPGAIMAGMDDEQVRRILGKNFDELRPVAGINNHEGSRVTMDPDIMRTVLEFCWENRVHFLDSRTTADTAAPGVASDMGFAIARRDVFLDNEQDRDSIIAAIEQGCGKAERDGLAVMIGHTWSPRLAPILTEMYPGLVKKGFFLTTVSGILDAGK
ncbi:MAG: divergent polysaccharide deacetylase family protein [Treponema sp.]|nr:divergent polysaccharide deacetylase family protein [Treponema sp.]